MSQSPVPLAVSLPPSFLKLFLKLKSARAPRLGFAECLLRRTSPTIHPASSAQASRGMESGCIAQKLTESLRKFLAGFSRLIGGDRGGVVGLSHCHGDLLTGPPAAARLFLGSSAQVKAPEGNACALGLPGALTPRLLEKKSVVQACVFVKGLVLGSQEAYRQL